MPMLAKEPNGVDVVQVAHRPSLNPTVVIQRGASVRLSPTFKPVV
jgi:hypothetical protein